MALLSLLRRLLGGAATAPLRRDPTTEGRSSAPQPRSAHPSSPSLEAKPASVASRPAPKVRKSAREPQTKPAPSALLLLGVDFGTAYTKAVWRDWGGVRVGVAAIGRKSEPLAESVVWVDAHGRLYLDDPGGARPERLLKMRLATRAPDDRQATEIAALCVFFVGSILRRAQAAAGKAFPGRTVEIAEAALGCPAAYCDDEHLADFNHVAEQAWRWAQDPQAPSNLKSLLVWIAAPPAATAKGLFEVRPEVAAAVDCFTMRPDADEGRYLFLDAGGGTIDGACFVLYRAQGLTKVTVLSTDVKPFGVELLAQQAAHRLGVDRMAAHRALLSYPVGREAWANELNQVGGFIGKLMTNARREDPRTDWLAARFPRPSAWRCPENMRSNARPLPVFFGGGGRDCQLYPHAARRADAGLRNYDIPPLALGEAAPPEGFEGAGRIGFHRFAVAYGLTREFDKAPDWKLPSRETAVLTVKVKTIGDRFGVDYGSSKDAYD